PEDACFQFGAAERAAWQSETVVDIPRCQFVPRVSVAFAAIDNGAKPIPTNHQVRIRNRSAISHYVWPFDHSPGADPVMRPPEGEIIVPLRKADQQKPLRLQCNIHQWTSGYVWALDTPYAAVTKEDGTYEITGMPAGAELMVTFWHEQAGFFHSDGRWQGAK